MVRGSFNISKAKTVSKQLLDPSQRNLSTIFKRGECRLIPRQINFPVYFYSVQNRIYIFIIKLEHNLSSTYVKLTGKVFIVFIDTKRAENAH